jgi:hypothetical protein
VEKVRWGEHLCLVQHRAGRLGDSDAILDAAGGEGGHGAAKPDGVIHRYVSNPGVCRKRVRRDV